VATQRLYLFLKTLPVRVPLVCEMPHRYLLITSMTDLTPRIRDAHRRKSQG
jgi:hypothetical protein